jgi:hypothetical protein
MQGIMQSESCHMMVASDAVTGVEVAMISEASKVASSVQLLNVLSIEPNIFSASHILTYATQILQCSPIHSSIKRVSATSMGGTLISYCVFDKADF